MKTKRAKAKDRIGAGVGRGKPAAMARTGSATAATSGPPSSRLRIKSILVPIDFSAPSQKALDYAVEFAEQFGAKLTLVHVVEPIATPDFAKSFPLVMENDNVMNACKAKLKLLVEQRAIDPKRVEKTLVRQGRSFDEIADAARTLKVDLIILSTHGYSGLKHVLLGSTTERVVRHASCPVLVVREAKRKFV